MKREGGHCIKQKAEYFIKQTWLNTESNVLLNITKKRLNIETDRRLNVVSNRWSSTLNELGGTVY
jgi:hypothetical protein